MGSEKKPSSHKKRFEQAKSRKARMKGKGGPENASCTYMGVRQRRWGKWVAEIREPEHGHRIWLGTYQDAKSAGFAYDVAAVRLYGINAKLNFPEMYVIPESSSKIITTTLPPPPLTAIAVKELPNAATVVCMQMLFPEPPTFSLCDQSGGFCFYWNYNCLEKPQTTITGGGDNQIADAQSYNNVSITGGNNNTVADHLDECLKKIRAWNAEIPEVDHTELWAQAEEEILIHSIVRKRQDNFGAVDGDDTIVG